MADVQRGVILNVPFAEKDEAKALGAKWDPDMRKWFVPRGNSTAPFEKWLSSSSRKGNRDERPKDS